MKPTLLKNAIPQPIFDYIQDGITGNESGESVLTYKFACTNTEEKTKNFVCVVDETRQQYLDYLSPLAATAASYLELDPASLMRMRVAITFNNGTEDRVSAPHIDSPQPHITGLLYMNDSDGDTILWDKQFSEGDETALKSTDGLTPLVSVKPEANSLLLFTGKQYHSSTRPKDTPTRAVVNFNFMVEDWV
jgi:hypothetical protein